MQKIEIQKGRFQEIGESGTKKKERKEYALLLLRIDLYPPRPMEMAPAATSAIPAVRTMDEEALAPESPAASANGTVRPSDTPMMISLTTSPAVKCLSLCCSKSGGDEDIMLNLKTLNFYRQ